jgi:hypothetical protein
LELRIRLEYSTGDSQSVCPSKAITALAESALNLKDSSSCASTFAILVFHALEQPSGYGGSSQPPNITIVNIGISLKGIRLVDTALPSNPSRRDAVISGWLSGQSRSSI